MTQYNHQFLQTTFDQFNTQFFNNELPPIKLRFSNLKDKIGHFQFIEMNKVCTQPIEIIISNALDLTQKQIQEALLLQMVHYYLLSKKIVSVVYPTNGYYYTRKIKEINNSQKTYKLKIKSIK